MWSCSRTRGDVLKAALLCGVCPVVITAWAESEDSQYYRELKCPAGDVYGAKDRLLFCRSGQASVAERESRDTEQDNKKPEQSSQI